MMMTPWVQRLLLANVVMYLVTELSPIVTLLLGFVPLQIHLRPWTPFTYMFLHAGMAHLFFNMIGLFFFGPRLEERLGGSGFLRLYILSGLGGALFSFLFSPFSMVVGASGAVFGVLLGFARYWPREDIYIWGVLPVQARVLALFLAFISIYSGVTGASDGVAHFAHLGGFFAAYIYLRVRDKRLKVRKVEKPNSHYRSPGVADINAQERWESMPREKLHELNRVEVENLLDKIKAMGVKGLSPDERAFLDRIYNSL